MSDLQIDEFEQSSSVAGGALAPKSSYSQQIVYYLEVSPQSLHMFQIRTDANGLGMTGDPRRQENKEARPQEEHVFKQHTCAVHVWFHKGLRSPLIHN